MVTRAEGEVSPSTWCDTTTVHSYLEGEALPPKTRLTLEVPVSLVSPHPHAHGHLYSLLFSSRHTVTVLVWDEGSL